jgi:DNA uptake protein ComE-like DNA-binding protein
LLDFLKYNRRDRLGLLALTVVTVGVWLWPSLRPAPPVPSYAFEPLASEEQQVMAVTPFGVDTVSESFLVRTGLNQRLAARWVNFRTKGGRIDDPEDVLRIYGMDTAWWDRWKEAMIFQERESWDVPISKDNNRQYHGGMMSASRPDSLGLWQLGVSPRQIAAWKRSTGQPPHLDSLTFEGWSFLDEGLKQQVAPFLRFDPVRRVEINHRSREGWTALPGIGEALAERIVTYGEQLGGYRETQQLLEVYGMDSTRWLRIQDRIEMGQRKVVKIKVNEATEERMGSHPYIGKAGARRLVRFRETVKLFEKASEVQRVLLITDAEMRKLAPYLEIP